MRRIVFGLLMAALVVWAWSSFRDPGAGVEAGEVQAGPDFAAMLANAPPARSDRGSPPDATLAPVTPPVPAVAAGPAPAAAAAAGTGGAEPDAEVERAFAALVAAVEKGDASARSQALRLLGREDLAPAHRQRLRELMGVGSSATDDVEVVLTRLGDNNAFLHSAEGRALGQRAIELIKAQPDDKAIDLGTRLLERCMRGSIERKDKAAIELVDAAYRDHRARADRVLCDPGNLAGARSYTVQKGDSLAAVAALFRRENIAIDETSLAILNRIHNPNAIRPGQRIRVPTDPIRAVVEKRSFLMAIYVGDRILRLFWVGHGADGKTPVAEFTVTEKLKNPDWDSPKGRIPFGSPENILGSYFLKFDHPSYIGFGAHGTPQPETIGTMSSAGCIRMYDADIEELFRLLPRKAKVEVRDSGS